MADLQLVQGTTSKSVSVFIGDSSVTTGAGLTGLAFNTASLIAYYWREGGTPTAITLATLAAITTAWSSGGFKEADATHANGMYRLDIPDAALAAGAKWVAIRLQGATNMRQTNLLIELTAKDNQRVLPLQYATANTAFPFLMTDSTNHNPATGKTVTCTRSIDGGAFGAGTLANVTEVANGLYTVDFGAGDLTGKSIVLRATATGCDDTLITINPGT